MTWFCSPRRPCPARVRSTRVIDRCELSFIIQLVLFTLTSAVVASRQAVDVTSSAAAAVNQTDVINVTSVTVDYLDVIDCTLDSSYLAELETCLKSGRLFLKKYLFRMGKDSSQCRVYTKFRSCLSRLSDGCASLPVTQRAWIGVLEQMDCVCNHSAVCLKGQTCFFDELYGFWSEKCDDLYRFNLAQKTRDACYFLDDNIQCKLALVQTACDDVTTRFAVSVLHINSEKERKEHQCTSTNHNRHPSPVPFSYSKNCTRRLIEKIDVCIKPLTQKNVVKFHIDYDLVPAETVTNRSLMRACRAWRKYRHCMSPLEQSCREGVEQVMNHQHDLRKYFLKMDTICDDDTYDEFRVHLRCYQKVVKKNLLGQCNAFWAQVQPWQQNTTAYQFYCETNHPNTHNLLRELQRVGDCHKNVFAEKCGRNASLLMSKLFRKAFNDPSYLRLGFMPDCALLAPTTTTTTTTTTEEPSTTVTPAIVVALRDRTIALASLDGYHILSENTPSNRLDAADNIRLSLQQSEANKSFVMLPTIRTMSVVLITLQFYLYIETHLLWR